MICFELPGFGFSYPGIRYDFSLDITAEIIFQVMETLHIKKASLSFSCANGFYALAAASKDPERFQQLFLAQTPSLQHMKSWVKNTIPKALTIPYVGQLGMSLLEKKFADSWYKYALPKGTERTTYQQKALNAVNNGGCFCLSGIVQGLAKEFDKTLVNHSVPTILVWGKQDRTHRKTNFNSILEHAPACKIIEFDKCGHFPDLEEAGNYARLIRETLL